MSVSAYIENLIRCDQNLIQHDRFEIQASLCFAEFEQGFIDYRFDSPSEIRTNRVEYEIPMTGSLSAHDSKPPPFEQHKESYPYVRISTKKQLVDILEVSH